MFEIFTDYTLRNVTLGSGLIGLLSGLIGSFAVLRKESLIGDALAHSTLPGIVLVFLITGTKVPVLILLGAGIAAWIANTFIVAILRNTKIKSDSALGIILSVFFGLGIVLLSVTQKIPNANQAGIESYIFGQAATIIHRDVNLIAIIAGILILILILFWKEFKILTFDSDYTFSIGFNSKILDVILSIMIVVTIVAGLQVVGVILMSSLIIAPAVAARQFTDKLELMVILSGVFGMISGMAGAYISSVVDNLPTGPTIIIMISFIVLVSLLFAPNNGIVWKELNLFMQKSNFRKERILYEMYNIIKKHKNYDKPHSIELFNYLKCNNKTLSKHLTDMKKSGLIEIENKNWIMTNKGYAKAENLFSKEN